MLRKLVTSYKIVARYKTSKLKTLTNNLFMKIKHDKYIYLKPRKLFEIKRVFCSD